VTAVWVDGMVSCVMNRPVCKFKQIETVQLPVMFFRLAMVGCVDEHFDSCNAQRLNGQSARNVCSPAYPLSSTTSHSSFIHSFIQALKQLS